MDSESKIKLASRLYLMRETAKELLGVDYLERMHEFGAILSETAAREKKDVLQVAVEVCKQPGCGLLETIAVLAAAVELVEPTYPNASSKAAGGDKRRALAPDRQLGSHN